MHSMPRPQSENTFQVAFKIPEAWTKKADELAAAMSRPGVTMTRTDALRAALWHGLCEMLREAEEGALRPGPPLQMDRLGLRSVLAAIERGEQIDAENLKKGLDISTSDPMTVEGWLGEQFDREDLPWLRRSLNQLREAGYVKKLRDRGYVLTLMGRAALNQEPTKR